MGDEVYYSLPASHSLPSQHSLQGTKCGSHVISSPPKEEGKLNKNSNILIYRADSLHVSFLTDINSIKRFSLVGLFLPSGDHLVTL